MNSNKLLIVGGSVLALLLAFWLLFLNHVNINQVGVAYDSWDGKLAIQTNAGWYVTSPFTKVVCLSVLPEKVQLMTSANIIAVKIVKLRQDKIVDFIKLQGFGYYINANFNNILMGYAFSGKNYDFLEIVQDSDEAQNK